MQHPKFIVVRFAPGAAGKFLSTLLMGSNDVAHYDPNVTTLEEKIAYFKASFPPDLSQWLLTEPSDKATWGTTFISNKHERGNNLSMQEFIDLAATHCTPLYHKAVNDDKYIVVVWHKNVIPEYFANSKIITIAIDDNSKKWFHRALWYKHFEKVGNKIHLKTNDPKCIKKEIRDILASFNVPAYVEESFCSFVKNNVIKSDLTLLFSNVIKLQEVKNDVIIQLSSLLYEEHCVATVRHIASVLKIAPIDEIYIRESFRYWRNLHDF